MSLQTRFHRQIPFVKAAASCLLVGLGLLRMAGDTFRVPALDVLGMATAAAPAPKVFSAVRGLETYSTRFYLEWFDRKGEQQKFFITPETYARIEGPYNRRNVYGAALAYAPVLPSKFRDPVMGYALCGDAPLMKELGIDRSRIKGSVRIWIEPLAGSELDPGMETLFEVRCR